MSAETIWLRANQPSAKLQPVTGAADIRCSWEVNRAGIFSCRIPVTELYDKRLPRPSTYVGWVLRYDHPTAGTWAGIVTMYGVRDGIAEFSAQSWEILTRKKLVSLPDMEEQAPGKVLVKVLEELNNLQDMPGKFKFSKAAASGQPGYIDQVTGKVSIAANPAVEVYDDLIPLLTDDANMEWKIDPNLRVSYAPRLGANRAARVILQDQKEIATAAWLEDLATVTNHLRAIGLKKVTTRTKDASSTKTQATKQKGKSKKKQPKPVKGPATFTTTVSWVPYNVGTYDAGSQYVLGPQMERRDYEGVFTEQAAVRRLQRELPENRRLRATLELDVVDLDGAWAQFREGDLIRVWLNQSDWAGTVRVMVRSLDVTRGVMTVACLQEPR